MWGLRRKIGRERREKGREERSVLQGRIRVDLIATSIDTTPSHVSLIEKKTLFSKTCLVL